LQYTITATTVKHLNKLSVALLTLMTIVLLGKLSYSQCGGVNFTADKSSGCSPLIVKFTAKGGAPNTTYSWDFGQGATSGRDTIIKPFTIPGKYTIKLTSVTNGVTCTVIKIDTIVVLTAPVPSFSVSPSTVLCNGSKPFILTDNTTGVASRRWTIDGVIDTNKVVNVKFATPGFKSVTLEVKGGNGCSGFFSDTKYLQVFDSVTSDFSADITVTKTAIDVVYTNCVQSGLRTVASYDWTFPGGTPSSFSGAVPPTVKYSRPLTGYNAKLVVTMTDGCTYVVDRKNFITNYITIPKDTFCSGKKFKVTNTANKDGRKNFNFQIPDASIDPMTLSQGGFDCFYSPAGVFDFVYSYNYGNSSCNSTVTIPKYVNILGPKVNFKSDDRNNCTVGTDVNLQNLTQIMGATGVLYTWTIRDTLNKVIQRFGPSIVPDAKWKTTKEGRFTITLLATSTNGCVDSVRQNEYIIVSETKIDFVALSREICMGSNIAITGKPTPTDGKFNNYTYNWTFQHADSTPFFYTGSGKTFNFEPKFPGQYNVKLELKNGTSCSVIATKNRYLTVNGAFARFSVDSSSGCNDPTFTVRASIDRKTFYSWPPLNPLNPINIVWTTKPEDNVIISNPNDFVTDIILPDATCYDIVLGLKDFQKECFSEIPRERAVCLGVTNSFRVDDPKCLNDTTGILNNSKLGEYETFEWSVTPSNFATFYPNSKTVQPKIIFNKDTCYKVTLTNGKRIRGKWCYTTKRQTVCTTIPGSVFDSPDTLAYCAPVVIRFDAQQATGRKFFWDFGDGQTLLTDNPKPAHVYNANNNKGYTVKMVALDSNGCSDTFVRRNYIKIDGPEPKFTLDKQIGCDSVTVTFKDKSIETGSKIFIYDDGSGADTSANVTHTYRISDPNQDSIVYRPLLLTNCTADKQAFYSDTVIVYRSPRADFATNDTLGCQAFTVVFTNTSYNAYKFWWDFNGDGIYDDSTKNPTHVFKDTGVFNVTLRVLSRGGCFTFITKPKYIQVLPKPIAVMQLSDTLLCGTRRIKFTNTSKDYEKYIFNPDDGLGTLYYDTLPNITYAYPTALGQTGFMEYRPSLTVISKAGCSTSVIKKLTVFASPKAGFITDFTYGCSPLVINFKDTSKFATAWSWDFNGDGIEDSKLQNPKISFITGSYNVRLIVNGLNACTDTALQTNYILVNPVLSPKYVVDDSLICTKQTVKFNSSFAGDSQVTRYKWKFDEPTLGQGDTSDQRNPSYSWLTNGAHNVSLTVWDQYGCNYSYSYPAVFVEDTLRPVNTNINYVTVNDNGEIEVRWTNHKLYDFGQYELIRADIGIVNSVTIIKDTLYTDISVNPNNQAYNYTLKTKDRCSNISLASEIHSAIYLKVDAPTTGIINLTWTKYLGWANLTQEIWRRGSSGIWVRLAIVDKTVNEYTDNKLCNENYTYKVKALLRTSTALFESYSNKASIQAIYVLPTATYLRIATVTSDKNVSLFWPGLSDTSKLGTYIIDRSVNGQTWQNGYGITTTNSFIDDGADVHNSSYLYRLRYTDKCGYLSPLSNEAHSIWLSHSTKNDRAVLNWNAYKDWQNGVNTYRLQLRDRKGKWNDIRYLGATTTNFTDEDVYPELDTAYCYRIMAISNNFDTSTSNVNCVILPSRIYVPNAFTPGTNDTLNNTWQVNPLFIFNRVGRKVLNYECRIYDRWGKEVWFSFDYQEGWNGKLGDQILPESVYIYRISARGIDNNYFQLRGTIHLLR